MFSPEGSHNDYTDKSPQYDFFDTLDTVIPNEDYKEYPIDSFGTMLGFDPKIPNEFIILKHSGHITATVTFTKEGVITNLSLERQGGESGEIEKKWEEILTADAKKAIREHAEFLRIEKESH